jgi:hypothetical protein
MDEQGICISNPGMDPDYYIQGQKEVIENFDGVKYSYEYADPSGRQGIFHGGRGDLKIKPREYIFDVADLSERGSVKLVLTDNITHEIRGFQVAVNAPQAQYVGDGIIGAWLLVGDRIIYVSDVDADYQTGLTVGDMINAPVYYKESLGAPDVELVQPRPLYIENIDAEPNWVQVYSQFKSTAFSPPEYYT